MSELLVAEVGAEEEGGWDQGEGVNSEYIHQVDVCGDTHADITVHVDPIFPLITLRLPQPSPSTIWWLRGIDHWRPPIAD
jgi:hypothetical protein